MAIMDEIKLLEGKREKLVQAAREEALESARQAIELLNELGCSYQLVEVNEDDRKLAGSISKRRVGIRDRVLQVIRESADGISRGGIIAHLDATSKPDQQAISNALAALKRKNAVESRDRKYFVVA